MTEIRTAGPPGWSTRLGRPAVNDDWSWVGRQGTSELKGGRLIARSALIVTNTPLQARRAGGSRLRARCQTV